MRALKTFRETITAVGRTVDQIHQRLGLLTRQNENLMRELAIMSDVSGDDDRWMADPLGSISRNPDIGSQEKLKNQSRQKEALLVDRMVPLIHGLAAASRCRHEEPRAEAAGRHWVPVVYQHQEAFKTARAMVAMIKQVPEMNRSAEPEKAVPAFLFQDDSRSAEVPWRDDRWRKWRRRALQQAMGPLETDPGAFTIGNRISRPEFAADFLSLGVEWGLFTRDDKGFLLLTRDIYRLAPPEIKTFLFQLRRGLTPVEFIRRCDVDQFKIMAAWALWNGLSRREAVGAWLNPAAENLEGLCDQMAEYILTECYENPPAGHPYLGSSEIERPFFMLKDSLSPSIMRLFGPIGPDGLFSPPDDVILPPNADRLFQ